MKLKAAIKLRDVQAYKMANEAGIDPLILSKLICGIIKIRYGDIHLIKVGKVLGLFPNECLQKESG